MVIEDEKISVDEDIISYLMTWQLAEKREVDPDEPEAQNYEEGEEEDNSELQSIDIVCFDKCG